MAISVDNVKANASKPAISCCRFEAGVVVDHSHLEDPALFGDLEDSGLLTIPADCYTIGQVMGGKIIKTIGALTPMTAEYVEITGKDGDVAVQTRNDVPDTTITATQPQSHASNSVIKLFIGEGKNIQLEIPTIGWGQAPTQPSPDVLQAPTPHQQQPKTLRTLKRRHFQIDNITFGDETKIDGTTLTLRHADQLCKEAVEATKLVEAMKLEIITPDSYNQYSETIMDVLPIATKEEGELGSGITRVLDGVVFVITGTDGDGVQIGEFGSSEGYMDKNIMWGRPGAPDKGDIFIKTQVTIKSGANMERPGPLAAHLASDYIMEEIRKALKKAEATLCVREQDFEQVRRPGKPKMVIVKEVMGQGAMHDNLILPYEPVGTLGAVPNVDLGNLPVVLSPLEVLDGAIHALTCIGPASKENSRHYFREPMVLEAMLDEEIDLAGIIFIGSPQANSDKFYVSKRLGMMIEAMDVDAAIVTTEGFGNNHIDFASHIEQIGQRGVAVVGMTYSAKQGALVVGNKYMTNMIDLNKSEEGIENEILCNNTLTKEDAIRALYMAKAVLGGEEMLPADKKWWITGKNNNISVIEKATGKKMELVDNETALPQQ
ncbi:MAG: D-proline reductase (dithiol) proprotein PrdA [Defluviitaleaceae bacterium]|nr:D-proline reductase (dithiol) proprotein PrdA [Defluviitaleaceae bacterium]